MEAFFKRPRVAVADAGTCDLTIDYSAHTVSIQMAAVGDSTDVAHHQFTEIVDF